MPGRRKKFIDKQNAVTFHLVHRSQRDPLQADDDASQRVLLPAASQKELAERKEEQRKFGVFYDDDYDYLQHLRDISEINKLQPGEYIRANDGELASDSEVEIPQGEPSLQLPSSVFASEVETEVGLLNKAVAVKGPQPDWDPDIVAALDEDFDYNDPDNLLEDDFILQANAGSLDAEPVDENMDGRRRPDFDDDQLFDSDDDYEDGDGDVASDEADFSGDEQYRGPMGLDGEDPFGDMETKSRFTDYSLSSSVMHRNKGLTLLDDRFEKLYEQYDDTEIGALDHEDLEGGVDQGSHLLNTILDQFEDQQKLVALKDVVEPGETINDSGEDSGMDDNGLVTVVLEEPDKKWDCESILSTYSNLYNHPRLIDEPKKTKINLSSKSGLPLGVLQQPGLTQKQIEKDRRQALVADRASTYRPKDETTEEKKSRKQAVKAERKERRAEKKANKIAFKVEQKRQESEVQNLQKNLQGVKIT
ncbi:protein LTV1 homolog [Liolophura sinensis]|uniref:protein LTV1 homolog n=1 Tax=Liolophura sinensis TaxID=3198878 RepID=UPI003158E44D